MKASVAITTPGNIPHPLFQYDSMEKATKTVESAIKTGLFRVPEHGVTVLTGPGTVFKVIAEDWEEPKGQPQDPFYVVVQTPYGAQFPPFGFDTKEKADNTILEFSVRGHAVFRGVPADKEITYIQGMPGMLAMVSSKEAFEKRLAQAQAEAMRKAQQEQQQGGGPRIILPR